ncbi:MAG TPA: hypothetical protein VFV11_03355 [Solimonas sp.]|nr:hypothetical protein [Solimonas sp.]
MTLRQHSLWLTGLALLAVHAAYLLSASAGRVPWCWPYIEGCTSISRAARHGEANLLFKLLMLPHAVLLAAFWWRLAAALASPLPVVMRATGMAGAAFLALYVLTLGADGGLYGWMRRYGITGFFGLTLLAECLAVRQLLPSPRRGPLLAACAALLGGGLLSLPLQHWAADRDAAVNALEWAYALLLLSLYPGLASAAERRPAPPG